MVLRAELMFATRGSSRISPPRLPGREIAPGTRGTRQRRWLSSLLVATAFMIPQAWLSRGAAAAETDLYVVLHYGVDTSVRDCWDETEFRSSVTHQIGYDPFRESASINARVRVGGSANAVDGQIEWRKANGLLMGERRFVAKDGNCVKLLTEMSFAVGLQIELLRPKTTPAAGAVASASPRAGTTSPGSAPTAHTGVATATTAPNSLSAKETPASTPKSDVSDGVGKERLESVHDGAEPSAPGPSARWPMWVGLGPSLAWRISPAVAGDARLFLGIRRASLSLEIGAEATYPSTETRWDGSGFRQTLLGGTLALCRHHEWLSACALGRASEVRLTGLGVNKPRSPTGFVAQGGLRLAATLPLGGPWLLTTHVDGLGALRPTRVVLNDGMVWEMSRLGVLAGMDLLVQFR